MKMLRMIAEAKLEGKELTLAQTQHNSRVTVADIALHLDRILRRGTRAAQYYIEQCIRYGYLDPLKGENSIGDTISRISQTFARATPSRAKKKSATSAQGVRRKIGGMRRK